MDKKRSIFLLLAIFVVGYGYVVINAKLIRSNYLYVGQLDLKSHEIFNNNSNNKIVFLGSSAVSGNNVPPKSTIVDKFNFQTGKDIGFNLGIMQANLLDANILLSLIKNEKVGIAILGLDPSILLDASPTFFAKNNFKKLKSPEMERYSKYFSNRKKNFDDIENAVHVEPLPPNSIQVEWKKMLWELRYLFWGNVYNKKIYGEDRKYIKNSLSEKNVSWELLHEFANTSYGNKIVPVVFLSPILNSTYNEFELSKFRESVAKIAIEENIVIFDYIDLLSSSNENFYDFVHLTPRGNWEVARKILVDLRENKLTKVKL